MKTIVLMAILGVVAARWEITIQSPERKQFLKYVVVVTRRHFPEEQALHISDDGENGLFGRIIKTLHGLHNWPLQVSQPDEATMDSINTYLEDKN